MNLTNKINQLKYPKEFRILPTETPIDELKHLEKLLKNLSENLEPNDEISASKEINKEFLSEVSVGAWRP